MIELKRAIAVLAVALVGGAALTSPAAAAAADRGPDRAAAHAAGAPVAHDRANGDRATVTEGQVREVAPGGVLTYPSVTSCLTVTVRLREGGLVGAHASLFRVPGELRSDEILARLGQLVGDRPVSEVRVMGAVGAWHPSYFVKAIEAYGDGEQPPYPAHPDPEGLADAVARGLGQPRDLVTVEDVPDGDQIVG
ncbi:hypothetical protein [Streptomyces sp. NPDC048606]|uniref:hypothetical protein n=1 Tax=Streptomyces sp. NPDC048606 TaxID=3154726 RepID=UPI0034301A1C